MLRPHLSSQGASDKPANAPFRFTDKSWRFVNGRIRRVIGAVNEGFAKAVYIGETACASDPDNLAFGSLKFYPFDKGAHIRGEVAALWPDEPIAKIYRR